MSATSEGDPPADFLAVLEACRVQYGIALPGRIDAVRELWRAILDEDALPAKIGELTHLAHSLAGSAGTFGFTAAGTAARALEAALGPWVEGKLAPSSQERAAIESAVTALACCRGN